MRARKEVEEDGVSSERCLIEEYRQVRIFIAKVRNEMEVLCHKIGNIKLL
jgi:hypothetical protein